MAIARYLISLLLVVPAFAANHHVRLSSVAVTRDGTDWTKAWNATDFNTAGNWSTTAGTAGKISPGDTVYFAGGNSTTTLTIPAGWKATPTARTTFKRATIASHGSSTGWSDAYDTTLIIDKRSSSGSGISFGASITDGRGSYTTWDGSTYGGWKIYAGTNSGLFQSSQTTKTLHPYTNSLGVVSYQVAPRPNDYGIGGRGDGYIGITVQNFELCSDPTIDKYVSGNWFSYSVRPLNFRYLTSGGAGAARDITVRSNIIWGVGTGIFVDKWTGFIIEHNDIHTIGNTKPDLYGSASPPYLAGPQNNDAWSDPMLYDPEPPHSNLMYFSAGPRDGYIRFNKFHHGKWTTGFYIDGSPANINIYGNVFYMGMPNNDYSGGIAYAGRNASSPSQWRIYNNTIISNTPPIISYSTFVGSWSACELRNNIIIDSRNWSGSTYGTPSGWTLSHNYYDTTAVDGRASETGVQSGASTALFQTYNGGGTGQDFRLKANTNPGYPLATPYDVDPIGTPRNPGWDRGAYEYTDGVVDTTAPTISDRAVTSTNATSAVVIFNTDENARSGITNSVGPTVTNSTLQASHSFTLTGLTAATTISYRCFATDAAGNTRVGTLNTFVTPAADSTPPSVSISAPAASAVVSNNVSIAVTASDGGSGLRGVKIYVDTELKVDDTSSPYGYEWNTSSAANGAHDLSAIADDLEGNLATNSISVTVDNYDPIPTNNLVLHLRFDEGAGIYAGDASGYDNHGRVSSAAWTTGKSTNCLSFSSGDYVFVTNSASLNITNAMTLAAWVRPQEMAEGNKYILHKQASASTWVSPYFAYGLYANVAADYQTTLKSWYTLTNGSRFYPKATSGVATNAWRFVVSTWDGTTGTLYVDGTAVGTATGTAPLVNYTNGLKIGSSTVDGETFVGEIDEVMIYSRALSAAEVQELYSPATPTVTPGGVGNMGTKSGMGGGRKGGIPR